MKLVFTIVFFYSVIICTQSQNVFNIIYRDTNAFVRNDLLYETKAHYISIGYYGITNKIGIHVRKYDKSNGNLVFHDVFFYKNFWLQLNGRTKIIDKENKLIFAADGDQILFKLEFDYIKDILIATDSIKNPFNKTFYIQDMDIINDTTQYFATIGDSLGWIFRYPDNTTKFVYSKEKKPRNSFEHFVRAKNGNYIFFGGKNDGAKNRWRIAATEVDANGYKICEEENVFNNSGGVEDILQKNENEVLLIAESFALDPISKNKGFHHILYKFDLQKKVFYRLKDMSAPTYLFGNYGAMVKSSHHPDQFFVCTMSALPGSTADSLVIAGRIVKIKGDSTTLWTKHYYKITGHYDNNDFNTMIPTSDGNYLIGGKTYGTWLDGWLVKIDEDGNILPIDTTSSATEQDIHNNIPEIKIYPNPASHSIIINQGEITDMTYQLTNMNGAVVKSIPLPHAHHHVVWDISDVASGTYVLTMLQGGKMIGSRQQVVIR